jgi:hypothetical protein
MREGITVEVSATDRARLEAINRYLDEHNRDPRPFVWTADPDGIVEKLQRAYRASASVGSTVG